MGAVCLEQNITQNKNNKKRAQFISQHCKNKKIKKKKKKRFHQPVKTILTQTDWQIEWDQYAICILLRSVSLL